MSPKTVDQRFISTYMTNDGELANEAGIRASADSALDVRVTSLETNSATKSEVALKYDASNPAHYVDASGAASAAPVQSVASKTGNVILSKSDVGLGSVDNTSDIDKPISNATQTALNAKYDSSNPSGYVNSSQASAAAPVQSVSGKIGAVTLTKSDVGLSNVDNTSDVNKPISTATQTALNAKYDASNPSGYVTASGASSAAPVQTVAGRTGNVVLTKSDVGLSNVDNTSDLSKPISTATQTALGAKLNSNSPITAGTGTKISYDTNGLVLSGSSAAITDLSDTSISNPTTNQILQYNGSAWVNASGAVVNAGPGVTYFLTSNSSGVSSYDYMSKTPDTNPEVDENITISNTTGLLASYIADYQINKATIDAGIWEFNLFSYVSSQSFNFNVSVYTRTTGGIETLLFTADNTVVSWTTIQLATVSAVQPAFSCNTTDKLVVKIYATTTKSNITCHLVHSGTAHYSHFHTPLVLNHNDIAGLQGGTSNEYYHLTSSEYNGVGTGAFVRNSTLGGYVQTSTTINGHALTSNVTVTKSDVGLSNVDNTSDVNKPVSTAQAAAIKSAADTAIYFAIVF